MVLEILRRNKPPHDIDILLEGCENRSNFLRSKISQIKNWVFIYFRELPNNRLQEAQDTIGFYDRAKRADENFEERYCSEIHKIADDRKPKMDKPTLIRWIGATTIWELYRYRVSLVPESQNILQQLLRRNFRFACAWANLSQDKTNQRLIIDPDWQRAMEMDLMDLRFGNSLELKRALRQFVNSPPMSPEV